MHRDQLWEKVKNSCSEGKLSYQKYRRIVIKYKVSNTILYMKYFIKKI